MTPAPAEAGKNIKSVVENKKYFKYFLCILSGLLLALAYPVFNLELLAFFAFVPLFFAIRDVKLKQAFFLSYLCGIIFFAVTIYWLVYVTIPGSILLILYLAVYFGIFGFLFKLLSRNSSVSTITIPAAWVLLEYVRSHLFTGFGWVLLGYSQYLNLPVVQIADVTGVWGVSFLVMLANAAIYSVLGARFSVLGSRLSVLGAIKKSWIAVLCIIVTLTYGYYKIYRTTNTGQQTPIKISVIQGSIPQYQKWDEDFKYFILERYETLTKDAAKDEPDLIIWPETAVPGFIGEEPELLGRILGLAKRVRTPILVGAVTTDDDFNYNSAVLISADGKMVGQYNKLHLVPFGEYIPLEQHLSFLRQMVNKPIGNFTPGNKYKMFELKNPKDQASVTRFGVLICFEDIVPRLVKRFVDNGADFMVNITNDAWFMRSSAPYQHAQASVFRAVENRVPVVRAANTGLSCFIDKTGRIYEKVMVDKKDIFVIGYKTAGVRH